MPNLSDSNSTDDLDQTIVKISGDTDETKIGNVGDRLKVDATITPDPDDVRDFYFQVAKGTIDNHFVINKFGINLNISSDTQDIWEGGGFYPWPASATTTTIVSTNTNDTSAGTGARTVQVYGLIDTSGVWTKADETATMNGTTAVTLSNSYIRVFRAIVRTAGSSGENAGDLQIKHSSTVIAEITSAFNQTLMAIYTTPSNTTSCIVDWYSEVSRVAGATGAKFAQMQLRIRPFGEVFQVKDVRLSTSDSAPVRGLKAPVVVFGEKTDILVRADSDSQNTGVSAGFQIVEVTTA